MNPHDFWVAWTITWSIILGVAAAARYLRGQR